MAFSIAFIISVVFSRPIWGLGILRALRTLKSKLLRPGRVPVENLLFVAFVRLGGGLIAPKTANIYFSNPRRKVKGGFGLRGNSFFNGLLTGILSTPSYLAWVQIKNRRLFCNKQIRTGSKIIASALNSWKTVYKCSRWAALSITSFSWCWEFF